MKLRKIKTLESEPVMRKTTAKQYKLKNAFIESPSLKTL